MPAGSRGAPQTPTLPAHGTRSLPAGEGTAVEVRSEMTVLPASPITVNDNVFPARQRMSSHAGASDVSTCAQAPEATL